MIYENLIKKESKLALVGLGYVGLPIALEFAKRVKVVGFDINQARVDMMRRGEDPSRELEASDFENRDITFTADINDLKDVNFFIVAVPTPIDETNLPDLKPLQGASRTVGKVLKKGDYVVFESTVYPGCTEEDCVPVLEKKSGLKFNVDFYCGYSPERINPGDKEHTVTKILKVTSGSTPEITDFIDGIYKSIITAGTYKASSIKVAEAAKVIENSQRDINIAFVNELSKIFNLMGIDTNEVLEAAGTKWNFLKFKPGLVGGHCIGVDPYYLAQKAQEVGYHPEIILAGRRLNDSMGKYVAQETIKWMMRKDLKVINGKVMILGFTFKEDCPDVRNTRVIDIYQELKSFDMDVDVYDPWADAKEVQHEYNIDITNDLPVLDDYSAIILAVAHQEFKQIHLAKSEKQVIFDIKGILPKEIVDARL